MGGMSQVVTMETKRCLVLMPIGVTRRKESPTFAAIYQHILVPALRDTGYPLDIFRGDEVLRSGMSLDEGRRWLQDPHLVLADLTTHHSGVLHDLTLRNFLAHRTILLSQHTEDIPVRFRTYRHILYGFSEAARTRLHQEIQQHVREIFSMEKPV
jgi:hypothetical protein